MNDHRKWIRPGLKIGLLGGSFNPAHEGHVHLSLQAMKSLKLDRVIWLVSPQNPLKSKEGMADYHQRVEIAEQVTKTHPSLHISRLEAEINSHYAIETISYLRIHHPKTHFVWLMGADNLESFHRWRGWRELMRRINIAVFDRAPFSHSALRSKAALSNKKRRLSQQNFRALGVKNPPGWGFRFMPRHAASATHLRKTLGKNAFLRHNKNCEE